MDNAWYAWDEMTPWRFAILVGVLLVTWTVIKLVERFGTSDGAGLPDEHMGDDDIVTNPAFRHFVGNMYHRHDED